MCVYTSSVGLSVCVCEKSFERVCCVHSHVSCFSLGCAVCSSEVWVCCEQCHFSSVLTGHGGLIGCQAQRSLGGSPESMTCQRRASVEVEMHEPSLVMCVRPPYAQAF